MPRSSFLTVRASLSSRLKLDNYMNLFDAAHRAQFRFPCYYCPFAALSERGRTQHIDRTPACREAALRDEGSGHAGAETMDMDLDATSSEPEQVEARYVTRTIQLKYMT